VMNGLVVILRDNISKIHNPLGRQVKIAYNMLIDTSFNYIIVCENDSCVHIENLIAYIEKEEKSNRISPTTDVAFICAETPDTFILTRKSAVNKNVYDQNYTIKSPAAGSFEKSKGIGTGIVSIVSQLSKKHPEPESRILFDSQANISTNDPEQEKQKILEKMRAFLYQPKK